MRKYVFWGLGLIVFGLLVWASLVALGFIDGGDTSAEKRALSLGLDITEQPFVNGEAGHELNGIGVKFPLIDPPLGFEGGSRLQQVLDENRPDVESALKVGELLPIRYAIDDDPRKAANVTIEFHIVRSAAKWWILLGIRELLNENYEKAGNYFQLNFRAYEQLLGMNTADAGMRSHALAWYLCGELSYGLSQTKLNYAQREFLRRELQRYLIHPERTVREEISLDVQE